MQHLPFSQPSISDDEIAAVTAVLRSGWITSGKEVEAFEEEFAQYCNAEHAVAVSSATAGIDLVLESLDLKPLDEIIVPSLNWVSGPNMVECNGAHCRFVDVEQVKQAINKHTRAIMPVHFAGHPCDLESLSLIAKEHDLVIIEDAAHAHGAYAAGSRIGSHSEIAIFSFHPSKNMTTGEGGMIVCNNADLAKDLRQQRFHGIQKNAWNNRMRSGSDGYDVIKPSRKYNMTDIAAAIGRCQLRQLDIRNEKRCQLANRYIQKLQDSTIIKVPHMAPKDGDQAVWHIFPVITQLNKNLKSRAIFATDLSELGIGTGLHYPSVHNQSYYSNKYGKVSLPNAEYLGERLLSLPLFPDMSFDDQDMVISAIKQLEEKYTC